MNNEVNVLIGKLAIVCLGIVLAIVRLFVSVYACVMAIGVFGYSVTMTQVFVALLAIATIRMKVQPKSEKSPGEHLSEECGKLIAAVIFTFVIWCIA